MMTKLYDLIYCPAGTVLIQYNKEFDESRNFRGDETYIGPSPIKYKKLEKPANILLLEEKSRDNGSKIWFEGEEWYIEK
jgi:hypothetical protein